MLSTPKHELFLQCSTLLSVDREYRSASEKWEGSVSEIGAISLPLIIDEPQSRIIPMIRSQPTLMISISPKILPWELDPPNR